MGIQQQMQSDMWIFFDPTNGFAVNVSYTPQGGSVRTIAAIMDEEIDAEFETGTADLDYDVADFHFRADGDVYGIVSVSEAGRGGAGDSFVLNGTTWYVKKKLARPADAATFEHVLRCSTSQAPLPDHFG